MIISLKDRQGFNTALSGVSGTSVQSAFTKPLIDSAYAPANISWLPYPYGPLPDTGPWAKSGDQNEKEEKPVPETHSEAQPWKAGNPPMTTGLLLVVICACAWALVKYMPGG